MRDKFHQCIKMGPFHIRKTLKCFSQDGSGGISFKEFQRAIELMGFQLT
jgi:hypothetical protein